MQFDLDIRPFCNRELKECATLKVHGRHLPGGPSEKPPEGLRLIGAVQKAHPSSSNFAKPDFNILKAAYDTWLSDNLLVQSIPPINSMQ